MVLPSAHKVQNTEIEGWSASATHLLLHIKTESEMSLTPCPLPQHWNERGIFKGKLLDVNLPHLENIILGKTELQFALENKRK